MDDIASSTAKGLESLWGLAPIVTILMLIVIALLYFIRVLLMDAREERNRYLLTLEKNTEAFNSLKEVILAAISVKQ